MRSFAVVLLLALGTAACSDADEGQRSAAAPGQIAAAAPAVAASAPAETPVAARKVEESSDLYEFDYAFPAAAGAIPQLRDWLEADLERQRAELVKAARAWQAEAKASGFPYNPYGKGVDWRVVADLPGWLSLSAQIYSYEGGAHPNHWFDTLLWDKRAGVRRDPVDLFAAPAVLSQAIRQPFCVLLDRKRAKRRGAEGLDTGIPEFSGCIDPVESTVILGSSDGKAFDRIGVLVAPYAAGPYAEGDYEITLPVTDAVIAALKPQYRSSFAPAG